MSKLNKDILCHIFQTLHETIISNLNNEKKYKKSLHSCLLVNKLWCETIIPILWNYPYKYVYKKNLLLNIIISHLSDNSIKLLKDKHIIETNFQKQQLSFNYVKFCNYLNDIHNIFPYDMDMQLKEEIYKLFISECSSIKCLSSDMSRYSIYKYPEANISLSNLFELKCSIYDQNFYHELAQICSSIEKIYIIVRAAGYPHKEKCSGIAELIEMQKQIKYIYIEEYYECKRVVQALEKHVNSIVYFESKNTTSLLHLLLPKLINLQFIRIHKPSRKFETYAINASYYNLQILELYHMSLDIAINIIENTNGNLWKIKIRLPNCNKAKEYNQAIHKYCPNIKYVTVYLNRDGTLEELENIFIKCQHLVAIDIHEIIRKEYFDKFLDLLVKSAPPNLYKINIDIISRFEETSKLLKSFFIDWSCRGKKTLHLYDHSEWNIYVDKMEGIIVCEYYNDDFWNHDIIDFWHDKSLCY
jgi:hypothetical protein